MGEPRASYISEVNQKNKYIKIHAYIESRKMVLMNLVEKGFVSHQGKVRVGQIEKLVLTHIHYHV